MEKKTLAEIIKEKTADSKVFSQRDLAHRAGISNTTVMRILKGQRAKPETLKKLAPHLGHRYEELMVMEGHIPETLVNDITPVGEVVMLPILGEIRGGQLMFAEQNIIGHMAVETKAVASGDYYYLRVSGDSMAPRIEPGDHVLVKAGNYCENGQVAVVMVEDEAALKRVYFQGNLLVLQSDNPVYKPYTVDVRDAQIYGCVKRIIKEA